MSLPVDQLRRPVAPPPEVDPDGDGDGKRRYYSIMVHTRLADAERAHELAARISDDASYLPEIFDFSTTVGFVDDPDSWRQVYQMKMAGRPE